MRRFVQIMALAFILASSATQANARWRGRPHADRLRGKKLDGPVKDKVDALLNLNKDYAKWTAGAPDDRTAKIYAFVHAATWADDIKTKEYNYTRDKVDSATAGQNIGYADRNQHAYWHNKNTNCSPDSTPLPPPDPVDLVTQLMLMIAALPQALHHWPASLTHL